MKLLVGLGNPGPEYERNRHNVGFMAIDRLAENLPPMNWRSRFQAQTADARIADNRVLLIKPQTYMNDSGQSVGEAARFLKIAPEDVIVFYDEIDLAPGKLKVKTGGGNAGHNGLRSISAHLGNNYVRVRIGVGHPGQKNLVANYVLRNFTKEDHNWLDPLLSAISEATHHLLADDAAKFTANVARTLNTEENEQPATRSSTATARIPGKTAKNEKSSPPQANEKKNKDTKSALADNLQKWLAGQSKKTSD